MYDITWFRPIVQMEFNMCLSQVSCGNRDCDDEPCNTAPTDKPSDFDCPSDGTFPDPNNCIKYYLCSGGVAVEKICPVDDGLQVSTALH